MCFFFHPKKNKKIGKFLFIYIFLKSQTIPLEDRTKHNPNKHNHRWKQSQVLGETQYTMISFVSKSANPMPKEPKECNIYIPSLFKHKFSSTKGPNTIFLFNLAKMAASSHTFYEHESFTFCGQPHESYNWNDSYAAQR